VDRFLTLFSNILAAKQIDARSPSSCWRFLLSPVAEADFCKFVNVDKPALYTGTNTDSSGISRVNWNLALLKSFWTFESALKLPPGPHRSRKADTFPTVMATKSSPVDWETKI